MVEAVTADWLRSDGLRVVAVNGAAAAWGNAASESIARTPYDAAAAAQAEAARQIAFLGPARAMEQLRVEGRQVAAIGRAVTLTADVEGYRAGALVFVIAADEDGEDGSTLLTVIRRLP